MSTFNLFLTFMLVP